MLNLKNKTFLTIVSSILFTNLYANDTQKLEEITVTAQKSEEDVQKVPMSVFVLNKERLNDSSITKLDEIGLYTPNLLLFNTGEEGLVTPSIRGISGDISSFSTPVSLYVDGVPIMNSFGYTSALLDVDRIEVLKGPQGTLYGKNSEVGVINVITNKPNNIFRGKLSTTIANEGRREYKAIVSGPIIKDKFYIGLAYKHDERDGFIKNTTTNKKEDNKEGDYGKINLRFTPTDNLDISLIATKSKRDDGSLDWAKAGQNNNIEVSSNLIGYSKPKETSYSLNVQYDIDDNTKFTSTSAKRNYKENVALDIDLTPFTISHIYRDYEFDSFSQEFKLENDFKNTKLTTGIFFSKGDDDIAFKQIMFLNPLGNSSLQNLNSKTYSFYTNIDTGITENFRINAGIRYEYEKKNLKVNSSNIYLEKNFENILPKLSLIYNFNKDTMMYFTVAKGNRSGGFNPFISLENSKKYTNEELISYELGYKTYLFNNSILFNSSIYYMNIDNMQVQLRDNTSNPYMANAAKATSKGIEVEIQAFLTNNLVLFANGALNHTTFDEYNDSEDYSGNKNPFSPKYNFNLGLQYENENGYLGKIDLSGYGKTYFDPANKYSQKAYQLVNTKIGYKTKEYEIYLYGKNIFDKKHIATNAYMNGNTSVYYDDKEFGIQLTYKF